MCCIFCCIPKKCVQIILLVGLFFSLVRSSNAQGYVSTHHLAVSEHRHQRVHQDDWTRRYRLTSIGLGGSGVPSLGMLWILHLLVPPRYLWLLPWMLLFHLHALVDNVHRSRIRACLHLSETEGSPH